MSHLDNMPKKGSSPRHQKSHAVPAKGGATKSGGPDGIDKPPIDDLVKQYADKRSDYAIWLAQVQKVVDHAPRSVSEKIHVIKPRLKDDDHLREKISRK